MSALAARHVEESLGLAARSDDHSLRGAVRGALYPGHVLASAGERLSGHVQRQQASQGRRGQAEGMLDIGHVLPAPGSLVQRFTVMFHADKKGTWAYHCHILNHAERDTGMFGMVTAVVVK